MKIKKLLISCAALFAVAASCMTSAFTGITSSAETDDCNDDWLHASGSRLYDMNGNEVWLTGANWYGFNCSENVPHGLYAADCDKFLSNVADKGINIIRFPISTELIYSWMKGTPNPVQSVQAGYDPPYVDINRDFVLEDGKTLKNSEEIFDIIMQKCKKYGIKALIDIHSPHSDNSGHNYNLWYGKETKDGTLITTDIWIDTLVYLADKYKNDDTIVAYDLKNEPHGKGQEGSSAAKWDDSTDENNWAYAATKCANAILDVNPNALILIEGVEQHLRSSSFTWGQPDSESNPPYYAGWWGGNLRGVKDYPIELGSAERNSQIVYSPHDYGPSVWPQSWFQKDFTTQSLLDDYWYDTWAYINDQDIAPLLIGEWGGHMDGAENQKWMELLRDYMIDNHINHTFWCLNPNSGDTGGLLSYDFMTWDEEKYGLFEKSLWQTNVSGKYIGLDHKIPLGENGTGMTVTEYYEKYADSEGSNLDSDGSVNPKPTEETTEPSQAETEASTTVTEASSATSKPSDEVTASKYGDVNLDGSVNIADVVAINMYLLNPELNTLEPLGAANADCAKDGEITTSDSLLLMNYVAMVVTEDKLGQ